MSRLVINERALNVSKIFDLRFPSTPEKSNNQNQLSRSKTLSISKKVHQALQITTSMDNYSKKAKILIKASQNFPSTENYLKSLIPEKEKGHNFLDQKVSHMAKLMKKEFLDEETYTANKLLKFDSNIQHKKNKISFLANNETMTNNQTLNLSISEAVNNMSSNRNLVKKRFNKILYSENYVERLLGRYDKYLEKTRNLNDRLDLQIKKHWENVLKEKNKQPKHFEEFKNENSEFTDKLMRETNFKQRTRERVKMVHQKKYFSMWNANQIPILGVAYNKKIN